jgi:hypothetical protein
MHAISCIQLRHHFSKKFLLIFLVGVFLSHRTAAKTAAEISAVAAEQKKAAKNTVISPPPASRTRSRGGPAPAQKKPEPATVAEAAPVAVVPQKTKQADTQKKGAAKKAPAPKGAKNKKAPIKAGVDDEIRVPHDVMSDSDDDVDDGPAQRLVVKLDKKQEKKLTEGLQNIKAGQKAPVAEKENPKAKAPAGEHLICCYICAHSCFFFLHTLIPMFIHVRAREVSSWLCVAYDP